MAASEALAPEVPFDDSGLAGHPRGLTTLFFTEMWERFSYYGMRALLILFMTASVAQGGLGWDAKRAATIYGLYTAGVYFTAIPGGWIADRLLGQRRAVLWGGVLIALGHYSLALNIAPLLLRRAGADRVRHRPPQAQHQLDGRPALRAQRPAPRRRVLHLLHGHQHGRAHRSHHLQLPRREDRLALGVRGGGHRHDLRARPIRARRKAPGPGRPDAGASRQRGRDLGQGDRA